MKNIKILNFDIYIANDYREMSKKAAELLVELVNRKQNPILGLATGGTPIGMYNEIIKMNRNGIVDFSTTTTFNLDEYYPIKKTNKQSYNYFMKETLFNHINIDLKNTYIPDGEAEDSLLESETYDQMVRDTGGIDLQILGIGSNAHIAFNEPSDTFPTKTQKNRLTQNTIKDNARFFNDMEDVPKEAITMGIGTIMNAKKIMLIANGQGKAQAIKDMIIGDVRPEVPASILQFHPCVKVILDEEAAGELLKY